MAQSPIPKEKLLECRHLVEKDNLSATAAARKVGVNKASVLKYLRDNGVIEGQPVDEEKTKILFNEYCEGDLNLIKFCKYKKINREKFSNNCREIGLNFNLHNKRSIDSNAFDIVDENVAYWLGMLSSDGYVNKNYTTLELSLIDKEHLEKFKSFLKSDHDIIERETNMGTIAYRFMFTDVHLVGRLKELGIYNAKSYSIVIPEEVKTPNLARHFLRGFIDGDGSITKGEVSITSANIKNLNTLKSFINEFCPYELNIRIYSYNGKAPRLGIHRNRRQLLDWLYDGDCVYLNRKQQKYKDYYCR